jgi:hypothetical protein
VGAAAHAGTPNAAITKTSAEIVSAFLSVFFITCNSSMKKDSRPTLRWTRKIGAYSRLFSSRWKGKSYAIPQACHFKALFMRTRRQIAFCFRDLPDIP